MTDTQQRAAAKAFAKNWKDRGYEKGDSQIFWVELLTTVFGVTEISQFISFEDQVHLDHTSFIDGYIEKTHVMIEQKSINKSLTAAIRQSDGSMLTPFEQAKRYFSELPYSKRPNDDINYALSGNGKATCNGKEEILSPGTCHICKKGSEHSIENTGDEDLVLLTVVVER